MIHYHIHKSPPFVLLLSQINSVYFLSYSVFRSRLYIILLSTPCLSTWSRSFGFPLTRISNFPYAFHVASQLHATWYHQQISTNCVTPHCTIFSTVSPFLYVQTPSSALSCTVLSPMWLTNLQMYNNTHHYKHVLLSFAESGKMKDSSRHLLIICCQLLHSQ